MDSDFALYISQKTWSIFVNFTKNNDASYFEWPFLTFEYLYC
jgi:hypothetical protein